MNILFITPSIPSRLHRIRAFEFIKALSKNHKVHVVCASAPNQKFPDELKGVVASYEVVYKPVWKSLLDCATSFFTCLPLEVVYCRSSRMNKVVNRIVQDKQIDLIYVKRLRSIQYVSDVKSDIPIILDVTDAMSLFYKRALRNAPWHKKILFAEEYFKYLAYEKRVAKKYRKWVTCSKIDREYLIKRLPDLDIEVIPNIVDTEYFLGKVSAEQNTFQHHSIIFSGLMDKFVNIEAADFLIRDIYPRIIKKYPDLKVYIVGPNPVSHIRKYRSTNIFVTGYVEDIRKYIEKADIVVCPIKTGTGVRNKILQAWAMGKPVVSTDQGLAGLVGVDGREILIANDGQSFAESIIKLFESESLRQLLIRNGNKIVKEKYSPEVMGQKLDQLVR